MPAEVAPPVIIDGLKERLQELLPALEGPGPHGTLVISRSQLRNLRMARYVFRRRIGMDSAGARQQPKGKGSRGRRTSGRYAETECKSGESGLQLRQSSAEWHASERECSQYGNNLIAPP